MAKKPEESENFPAAIVVPSDRAPTLLNDHTLDGAIIGNLLGGRDNALLGTVAGGAIGGMIGKERMEHEYREGRTVHKPSPSGLSIALGILGGGLFAGLMGALLFEVLAIPGLIAIAAAGAAVGGLLGYAINQSAANDYEAAKSYYAQHGGHYQGREREHQQEIAYRVTPEEYARLQTRLAMLEQRSHTQNLDAEPSLPQRQLS